MEVFYFEKKKLFERCHDLNSAFTNCKSLKFIANELDVSECTAFVNAFHNCYALRYVRLKGLKVSVSLSNSAFLHTTSILYMISNAANGTTDITITLHKNAYDRAVADSEIQAALAANGHIQLLSA